MDAPIDLAVLKDDLNIDDDYSDEWLQRRVNAIWSRIETVTGRILRAPPATFRDDWSAVTAASLAIAPPLFTTGQERASIYLRQFPVVSIDAMTIDGEELDEEALAAVTFDKETGRILTLDGNPAFDVGQRLFSGAAVIDYTAGWDELPADLHDIVLQIVSPLWIARQAQTSDALTNATSIDIADVGSISLQSRPVYADIAAKSGGDPVLGPFKANLGPYIDYRTKFAGAGLPSTELVEAAS